MNPIVGIPKLFASSQPTATTPMFDLPPASFYLTACPNTKSPYVGSAATLNFLIRNIRGITPGASMAAIP